MDRQAADFCLLLIFATVAAVSSVEIKNIKFEEFRTCPDNDELVAKITHHEIERVSENMISLNVTMELKKEITEDYSVWVDLKRCESSSESHTCKQFMTKEADNFCDHIQDPEQSWTDYVQKTEPELKCPIKEGTYVTTNALLDASLVEGAPEGYWLAEIKALDGEKVLGCFQITASIRPEEQRELPAFEKKGMSSYL